MQIVCSVEKIHFVPFQHQRCNYRLGTDHKNPRPSSEEANLKKERNCFLWNCFKKEIVFKIYDFLNIGLQLTTQPTSQSASQPFKTYAKNKDIVFFYIVKTF